MRKSFDRYCGADAPLYERVESALTAADFPQATQALAALPKPREGAQQLYAAQAALRLAGYLGEGLEARPLLAAAERSHAQLDAGEDWPQLWYALAWLYAPFACGMLIDAFFIYYSAMRLPRAEMRQQCLPLAIQYGVHFEQHHFTAHLLQQYPFSAEHVASDFDQRRIDLLIAVYQRDPDKVQQASSALDQAASTPLESFIASKLKADYSYLISTC
jgi:hypothetical protein